MKHPFKVRVDGRVYVDRATVTRELDEMLAKHGVDTGLAYELDAYTTVLDGENPEHYGAFE